MPLDRIGFDAERTVRASSVGGVAETSVATGLGTGDDDAHAASNGSSVITMREPITRSETMGSFQRCLVSTPLVANGVMYFIGSLNVVRAEDATSGRLIWTYDPKVTAQAGDRMRVGWDHNRGIALWRDKIILAT